VTSADGQSHHRILVVDDDEDIARFVEMNLVMEGFEVVVAHDGAVALDMVRKTVPDLIILDLMMPEVDGVEVTRRLRADALTSALPIIMLTAKGQTPDKGARCRRVPTTTWSSRSTPSSLWYGSATHCGETRSSARCLR
jgi:CheY-like chemotaxis protein